MRIFLVILMMVLALPVQAQLKVTVTQGQDRALPIAVSAFLTKGRDALLAEEIREIVIADLENSGLFEALNRKAFIQKNMAAGTVPEFADWRQIGAQGLVVGSLTRKGDAFTVQFRLWDILSQKQLTGRSFTAPLTSKRRIGHMMADEIYERMTGEQGYFDTRIVYIAEATKGRVRTKQLAIMDQDGENHLFLTDGRELVLTPRFDKQAQRIIYLAYHNRKPSVYLYDLETGKEELLGRFDGMSYAPRFSFDGKQAIMSVAKDGASDIYLMDLATQRVQRITKNRAIDTSPSMSPDGQKIAFNSDRDGGQEIYVMDKNGGGVKRISYGSGSYATPVWSPRGDLIAFTKMYRGKFHIGVMKPDGSAERLLTESYLDEGPTWAPSGRALMFSRKARGTSKRSGRTQLYRVDLAKGDVVRVVTPLEGSDPAWSPLLSR